MNLESRVESLRQKHRDLDAVIEAEERHPSTDHLEILALKRRKLKIKDEIRRLAS